MTIEEMKNELAKIENDESNLDLDIENEKSILREMSEKNLVNEYDFVKSSQFTTDEGLKYRELVIEEAHSRGVVEIDF